jgi:streptogramin lyase
MWGEGGRAFDPADADQTFDGTRVDDRGWITLGDIVTADSAVWVSNSDEGTVSKLDAQSGREVARYPSAATHPVNGARPWNEPCDGERTGNCPSRTALDFRRDAWVANRAFGGQGSVTKIANTLEDCVDQNGDGVIQTSRDANDDGRIDISDPAEFVGTADECVLFTVDVGEPGDIPRALAIAPDTFRESIYGNAWIGLNHARKAVELRGTDGATIGETPLEIDPYGALADKHLGVVWFTNAGWQARGDNPPAVQSVEFATGTASPRYAIDVPMPGCDQDYGTYGITVDEAGRVWVAGYPCEGAFRLDPTTAEWVAIPTPGHGRPRGLVADGEGTIWMAHSHCSGGGDCATLSTFNIDPPWDVQRFELRTGGASGSIGVDIDLEGRVWVINRESSSATRFDPTTGRMDQFPVGDGPYTYSDFTGHGLFLQFPRGYWRAVNEGCEGAIWSEVTFEGSVPAGSLVEVSVRTADTRDGLRSAPWIGTWMSSPARLSVDPGPVAPGRFMEVQLGLISEEVGALPSVARVAATYMCPVY